MSSKGSEEMMGLLQELALMRQAETTNEGSTVHSIESLERRNRRREIADQIKALGEPEDEISSS